MNFYEDHFENITQDELEEIEMLPTENSIDFAGMDHADLRKFFAQHVDEEFYISSSNETMFKEEKLVTIYKAYNQFVVVEKPNMMNTSPIRISVNYGALICKDDVLRYA